MRYLACVTCLLSCFVPASLDAQYVSEASDTLRYAEATNGMVEMSTPNGSVVVRSLHDAHIAVTFPGPGRAQAWYEALTVESSGPMGSARPGTSGITGQPYEFQFAPTGHVTGMKTPPMPPEIAEMTDLTRQFDFFITVPTTELSIGAAWSDTVVNDQAGRESDKTFTRHVRSYVVERDTSIGGVRALLIRINQTVELTTSSEVPEQNMTLSATLKGTDTGWALFAPTSGRMLERERHGSLKGEMLMEPAGMAAMRIPQTYTYDSRISLR